MVTVPDLPGCITQIITIDEAPENAREPIEAYLEASQNNQISHRDIKVCVRKVLIQV